MVITKLQGGLGNQMFQYAIGRNLSIKNNTDLKLDISFYPNNSTDTKRDYSLGCFNIIEDFSTEKDTKKIGLPNISSKNIFLQIYRKIIKIIKNNIPLYKKRYVTEPNFNFDKNILKVKDNSYLNGNWQSEKYFIAVEDIIRKEFSLKKAPTGKAEEFLNQINERGSISIHIRRGDYISSKKINSFHGICSLNYYEKAVKIIKEKVTNPTFFVFSDDIKWVKENLKVSSPVVFVSDGKIKDYEELTLMSKCQHNIIANSSFSWWSAWLNNNPNKIVIAPKKWFNNTTTDTSDLIPESWLKI